MTQVLDITDKVVLEWSNPNILTGRDMALALGEENRMEKLTGLVPASSYVAIYPRKVVLYAPETSRCITLEQQTSHWRLTEEMKQRSLAGLVSFPDYRASQLDQKKSQWVALPLRVSPEPVSQPKKKPRKPPRVARTVRSIPPAIPLVDITPRQGCVFTHIGRRPYQEDRYSSVAWGGNTLYAVYDGHGGEEISASLAQDMPTLLKNNLVGVDLNDPNAVADIIEETYLEYDQVLYQRNAQVGSGSTAVVVLGTPEMIYLINLGDSRAVIIDTEDNLWETKDHKPQDPPEEHRASQAGVIQYGGRFYIKNIGLAVARAFGDFPYKHQYDVNETVMATMIGREAGVTVIPTILFFKRQPGVTYTAIVGSDGLFDSNRTQDIVAAYETGKLNCQQIVESLGMKTGDNTTIIVGEI